MVPLRRNGFKRQAKSLALSGRKRRDSEIHGFRIRAGRLQYLQRNLFPLYGLPHVIFEVHVDHYVRDRFIAGVGDGSVNIADSGADKILGRTHFKV